MKAKLTVLPNQFLCIFLSISFEICQLPCEDSTFQDTLPRCSVMCIGVSNQVECLVKRDRFSRPLRTSLVLYNSSTRLSSVVAVDHSFHKNIFGKERFGVKIYSAYCATKSDFVATYQESTGVVPLSLFSNIRSSFSFSFCSFSYSFNHTASAIGSSASPR